MSALANVGTTHSGVLAIAKLKPAPGAFTGAPLLIHGNPESFRTSGVLGSTLGPVPGRGDGSFDFPGHARLFALAHNRVGETFTVDTAGKLTRATPPRGPQRFSVVLRNTSSKPLVLQVTGVLYSKHVTPQFPLAKDGTPFNPLGQPKLDEDYTGLVDGPEGTGGKVPDPKGLFFRGPRAVVASGLLDAQADRRPEAERKASPLVRDDLHLPKLGNVRLGTQGYFEGTLAVKPGETVVVADAHHEKGGEIVTLVDFKAVDGQGRVAPSATFRLATVSSPQALTPQDLGKLARGEYPAAGGPDDFAPAGGSLWGRPNGVVKQGSVFQGGRTVSLTLGQAEGDLFMSTRLKHAGDTHEVGTLSGVLGNLPGRGGPSEPARTNDGGLGASYDLTYTLENRDPAPRRVEVLFTAPGASATERFFPQGGVLTLPVKVDGRKVNVRVNQRGEGVLVAVLELPPGGRRDVRLEWNHLGNTFPPAGIELRMRE